MFYIGIIGYGTVGSGVYEVIQTNKENISYGFLFNMQEITPFSYIIGPNLLSVQ